MLFRSLSRSDISKREYIGEVAEICGTILTVDIVWPTSSDDSSRENILKGSWYLYKFPSLVGYRRTSAALKALQGATKYGQNILEGIVGSFCVDDLSSQDSRKQVDKGSTTKIGMFSSIGFIKLCLPVFFKSMAKCELFRLLKPRSLHNANWC